MKKICILVASVLAFIGAGVIASYFYFTPGVYYTQIDNSKMEEINVNGGVINTEGSLPYKYSLTCYDGNGDEKSLSFTASKELREGAFIRLVTQPMRGIVSWEEVKYENLPQKVQSKYNSEN